MVCYMIHQEPQKGFSITFTQHCFSSVVSKCKVDRNVSHTKLLAHVSSICHEDLTLLPRHRR